jgi:AcrR family transcriptional regulator
MSPRAYRMGVRQAMTDETRARIVAGAREMLSEPNGIGAFTIDAVAVHAGVARMTVYHHFGSKIGLIEAVFDSLAIVRVGIDRLLAALELRDPQETLAEFIRTFSEMWEVDRLVIRRLQGLAALDPEFSRVWQGREARRREGLRHITTRASAIGGATLDVPSATAILFAIVSYDTFDAIAGPDQSFTSVAPLVLNLARKALDMEARPKRIRR